MLRAEYTTISGLDWVVATHCCTASQNTMCEMVVVKYVFAFLFAIFPKMWRCYPLLKPTLGLQSIGHICSSGRIQFPRFVPYTYIYIYVYTKASIRIMLKLWFNRPTFLQSCQTMSSRSMVGLTGAPSTLIHSFLAIRTILHPSHMHRPIWAGRHAAD